MIIQQTIQPVRLHSLLVRQQVRSITVVQDTARIDTSDGVVEADLGASKLTAWQQLADPQASDAGDTKRNLHPRGARRRRH